MEDLLMAYPEWENQAIPVLRWVKHEQDAEYGAALLLRQDDFVRVAEQTGLDEKTAIVQLTRLIDGGLLDGEPQRAMGRLAPIALAKVSITKEGLQAVKVWPRAPAHDDVVGFLVQMAQELPEGSDDRSGVEKMLDGMKGLGRDTFIHVVGELAKLGVGGI
jgi:hypothetical protein